jgi:hypothetical protein
MPYFPDLTPYEFLGGDPGASSLNIGWLDKEHTFNQGPVEQDICKRIRQMCLFELARQTRGFHGCPLCLQPLFGTPVPGETVLLGSAEIRVKGASGIMYAAPNLIYHYITEHAYQPPAEFMEAVREFASLGSGASRLWCCANCYFVFFC